MTQKGSEDLSVANSASAPFDPAMQRDPLRVRMASPRGFCAGVERAVAAVEAALHRYGPPVYVRHEIVHNAHVVNRLRAMGAVFVEEVAEAADDRPIVFSAHGAPRAAYAEAAAREMTAIDATCPLVLKVHNDVKRHAARGRHVILIGHAGHPEVNGVIGQTAPDAITLVQSCAEAARIEPPTGPLAYATQTTLSLDDTAAIIAVLERRFPHIAAPGAADICYATTNRQAAVKATAAGCDLFLVVGDTASSNSTRLVETARRAGARAAALVPDPAQFDVGAVQSAQVVGVSAGASAPETLVEELLARLAGARRLAIETIRVVEENVAFKQPPMGERAARG